MGVPRGRGGRAVAQLIKTRRVKAAWRVPSSPDFDHDEPGERSVLGRAEPPTPAAETRLVAPAAAAEVRDMRVGPLLPFGAMRLRRVGAGHAQ